MDFVTDALASGCSFRTLNITDDYSREAPAIEVDTSLSGVRVARVLDRLKVERGLPCQIRSDNGPEFISKAVEQWLTRTAWPGTSSSRVSRSKMPTSKASTLAFGMSV